MKFRILSSFPTTHEFYHQTCSLFLHVNVKHRSPHTTLYFVHSLPPSHTLFNLFPPCQLLPHSNPLINHQTLHLVCVFSSITTNRLLTIVHSNGDTVTPFVHQLITFLSSPNEVIQCSSSSYFIWKNSATIMTEFDHIGRRSRWSIVCPSEPRGYSQSRDTSTVTGR